MSVIPLSVIESSLRDCLTQIDITKSICIAYSGGIDSTVLLHAVSSVCASTGHSLKAIHINHQLHADAQLWEQHCISKARLLNVAIETLKVDVAQYREHGIEGAAREARYQAFTDELTAHDVLLTAHHADDQIETVLLQLFRGTGVQGLAGCAQARTLGDALLMRPLLNVSRQDIDSYAQTHQLNWLDDPSNDSLLHDRNYLRHEIMPLLHSRWQGLRETIGRSAQWQDESANMLEYLASTDLSEAIDENNLLTIEKIAKLDNVRLKNALRGWIRRSGCSIPSADVLERVINDAVYSREDCEACIRWQSNEIRKYRGCLYLRNVMSEHDPTQTYEWNLQQPLDILSPQMTLTSQQLEDFGVNVTGVDQLSVRFRVGGEVMRPRGRGCQKELKALFQEAGIEPWLRDRIPLLFDKQKLIFVWGHWISEGY